LRKTSKSLLLATNNFAATASITKSVTTGISLPSPSIFDDQNDLKALLKGSKNVVLQRRPTCQQLKPELKGFKSRHYLSLRSAQKSQMLTPQKV